MLDIQRKLLDRMLAQLDGMNAKYAIVIDGEKFGTLEVAPDRPRANRVRTGIDFKQFKIRERLEALKVGEVLVIDVPAGINVRAVQSNACARAASVFGPGNSTTCRVGQQVQLIREG